MEKNKNYSVEIVEAKGACNSDVFKKMASNGDIQSEKVTDNIGKVFKLTGYAICNIKTADKEFNMGYYSTDSGILSTGSEVFKNSVEEYYGEIDTFKIVSIKTKKGTTYKVTPVLVSVTEE